MKAIIYADNTMSLAVSSFCDLLNSVCTTYEFAPGTENFRLSEPTVSMPDSYNALPRRLIAEAERYNCAFLCTSVPYEDNYFFHSAGTNTIISFSGWNVLTDLPIANGLAYFIARLICGVANVGELHQANVGCVNDFWWDKAGVNLGMRAGFICQDCKNLSECDPSVMRDIQSLLDIVSHASRAGRDVLQNIQPIPDRDDSLIDVFLCHNNNDKPAVRVLNTALKDAGVFTWLDEEKLELGIPWQPELERQIGSVRAACVLVGENGTGPWQDAEIRAFLSEFVSRGCPVIPVILPDAQSVPELPLFLRQMTWLDLRHDYQRNLLRLIGALRNR